MQRQGHGEASDRELSNASTPARRSAKPSGKNLIKVSSKREAHLVRCRIEPRSGIAAASSGRSCRGLCSDPQPQPARHGEFVHGVCSLRPLGIILQRLVSRGCGRPELPDSSIGTIEQGSLLIVTDGTCSIILSKVKRNAHVQVNARTHDGLILRPKHCKSARQRRALGVSSAAFDAKVAQVKRCC